jgi:hypothetical protein
MKTKEEIEQLSEQRFPTDNSDRFKNVDFSSLKIGFFEGYTQCQEDMADKKYTELQLRFFANELIKGVQSLILSLNKQDK